MALLICFLLGLSHVDNPETLEKPLPLKLTQDLTLGGEEAPEEEIFSGNTSVLAQKDGSFYILDTGNFRILKFDTEGKKSFEFGRKGAGPGEFSEPVAMTRSRDQILIFDTGTHKVSVFDNQGNFQKDMRFPSNIHGVYQPVGLPNGGVVLTCYTIGSGMQMAYLQAMLDAEMKMGKTLYKTALTELDFDRADSPGYWVDFLTAQFNVVSKGWPLQALIGDQAVTLRTHEYRGRFHDTHGKDLGSFSKKYKPRAASDEAREAICDPIWQSMAGNPAISDFMTVSNFNKAMNKVENLERLPPTSGLAPLGKGFAVLANYDPVNHKGSVDVYSAQGKLVGQVPYEGPHHAFTGGGQYLFAVGADEDDFIVVNRYRIDGLPQ